MERVTRIKEFKIVDVPVDAFKPIGTVGNTKHRVSRERLLPLEELKPGQTIIVPPDAKDPKETLGRLRSLCSNAQRRCKDYNLGDRRFRAHIITEGKWHTFPGVDKKDIGKIAVGRIEDGKTISRKRTKSAR